MHIPAKQQHDADTPPTTFPLHKPTPLPRRDLPFSLGIISSALFFPSSSHEHLTTLCYLQFFRITKTSPHSSSEGRKISGTTMRIFLLGGGLMFHVHSTLAG